VGITRGLRLALIAPLILGTQALATTREGQGEAVRLLKSIAEVEPAVGRAVSVHNARIDMGPGTLVIEKGVLIPAESVEGRTLEVT